MGRSEDGVSSVIFLQHMDRHVLHLRPIFDRHILCRNTLILGRNCSSLRSTLRISIFVGGGDLLGDGTVGASNANDLA